MGGSNAPKAFFERLRQGGIAVLEFNPINPLAAKGMWKPTHRDHRKLLVVDGRIASLGGINISSVYGFSSIARRSRKASANMNAWSDTDLQSAGPVVSQFQKFFMQTREKQRGLPLVTKSHFPVLQVQGKDIVPDPHCARLW